MKAVLFDLDGTLLDTRDMILESFKYAHTKVLGANPPPPEEELLSLIGIPLKTQMELIAPSKSEELFLAYQEKNKQICESMLGGFAGTEAALERLLESGLRLAVITSKRHDPAVQGLVSKGLDGYFEFVIGADDVAEHKPKPGPLLVACERMGLAAEDCAYVGDSPYDMQAARSARMQAVGVLWGMFSKQVLLDAGAEVLISDFAELPDLFIS